MPKTPQVADTKAPTRPESKLPPQLPDVPVAKPAQSLERKTEGPPAVALPQSPSSRHRVRHLPLHRRCPSCPSWPELPELPELPQLPPLPPLPKLPPLPLRPELQAPQPPTAKQPELPVLKTPELPAIKLPELPALKLPEVPAPMVAPPPAAEESQSTDLLIPGLPSETESEPLTDEADQSAADKPAPHPQPKTSERRARKASSRLGPRPLGCLCHRSCWHRSYRSPRPLHQARPAGSCCWRLRKPSPRGQRPASLPMPRPSAARVAGAPASTADKGAPACGQDAAHASAKGPRTVDFRGAGAEKGLDPEIAAGSCRSARVPRWPRLSSPQRNRQRSPPRQPPAHRPCPHQQGRPQSRHGTTPNPGRWPSRCCRR